MLRKYYIFIVIGFSLFLFNGCNDNASGPPVTVLKTERNQEKHPEIKIAPKENTDLEAQSNKDSFKEIAEKQASEIMTEDSSLPLSLLSNHSGSLTGMVQNQSEIAKSILSILEKNKSHKKRPLRIAYFNPQDRKPIPGFQSRIQKIMTELQAFYGKGMEQNGFGHRTFDLEMEDEKLVIHFVQSKEPKKNFSRNRETSDKVYNSVAKVLKEKSIDIEKETVIVFQNLARVDENNFYDTSAPYFGTWNTNKNRKGFCYVVDSKFLDWNLLVQKKDNINFNGSRNMSMGQLASGQIGGVCHELGHAFCLNHTCANHPENSKKGTALMGYGNWTFGQEKRKEGKGTYLSFISAAKLMGHPCFSPLRSGRNGIQLTDLSFKAMNGILEVQGSLKAETDVYAVIAYCDNLNKQSDYDATGWVGSIDSMGKFAISINELEKNTPYKLNLQFLHVNGGESSENINFKTDNLATPLLQNGIREKVILKPIIISKVRKDEEKTGDYIRALKSANQEKSIDFLLNTVKVMDLKEDLTANRVLDSVKSISLSRLNWDKAYTGYNSPRNNRVHEDNNNDPWPFLTSNDRIHRFGLYAHANSEYTYNLDGKWKKLKGRCSLRKGMKGSVVFIIKGDGKELFNSGTVKSSKEIKYSVDLSGIKTLSLIVNDAGDGRNSDWGQWLSPRLSR